MAEIAMKCFLVFEGPLQMKNAHTNNIYFKVK